MGGFAEWLVACQPGALEVSEAEELKWLSEADIVDERNFYEDAIVVDRMGISI